MHPLSGYVTSGTGGGDLWVCEFCYGTAVICAPAVCTCKSPQCELTKFGPKHRLSPDPATFHLHLGFNAPV